MFFNGFHLSDQDVLLAVDRELPPRRLARARTHFDRCERCRERRDAIAGTLATATEVFRESRPAPLPPAGASRARLGMRLAELSRRSTPGPALWTTRWALACGTALVVAARSLWLVADRTSVLSSRALGHESAVFLLPRAELTPGAARPITSGAVCGADRGGRTQPVPMSVRQRVFESYGADYQRSTEYELDYLITPELGGTPDARNLWPQSYSRTLWNAYVKDELELHLHRLACDGTIDFLTAQQDMATNWIAAYKRYFKTEKPLRDYAASPLTERDGNLLRAELEELGMPIAAGRSDGPALMAMLLAAR